MTTGSGDQEVLAGSVVSDRLDSGVGGFSTRYRVRRTPPSCDQPVPGRAASAHEAGLAPDAQLFSYPSRRRNHGPVSLPPFGARWALAAEGWHEEGVDARDILISLRVPRA
jgi:hypothetical protein